MISIAPWLLPVKILIYFLNAGLVSLAAFGIGIALSRRAAWSLPARHAVLVAALAVSLSAPLILPLIHAPSLWTMHASASVGKTSPAVIAPPTETIRRDELPIAATTLNADTRIDHSTEPDPSAVIPLLSADHSTAAAATRQRQPLATIEWGRVIGTLLCGVWLVGISLGLARALMGLASLRRWIQTAAVVHSHPLTTAARSAANSLGLRFPVPIFCSNLLPAPVTMGLLRPRIMMPVGIESTLAPDQLLAVVRHEMAHIARRDLWIGLLQRVAAIVFWWNPLVRWANCRLADIREQICDDIAIRDLSQPSTYAATLIRLAERCSLGGQVPATLGIGSSPAGQFEGRIRRILSSSETRCVRLTPLAMAGVSAAVILMVATILIAQIQVKSPAEEKQGKPTTVVQSKPRAEKTGSPPAAPPITSTAGQNPTLSDLIQQMAAYEQRYLPFDVKAMETFRFPGDLTPQERAKNLRADGRKHQRLMEYAQLERRIWRKKETELIDDEQTQSYEQYSDGERIIQISPSPATLNGKKTLEYYINNRKNDIFNYQHATPLLGIFCLSSYGGSELFSEIFKADEKAVELSWDNGDAKLTFGYGHPKMRARFVLWLSRAHAWHPVRLQRYLTPEDKLFFDEWEVTKFVQHGTIWRVAEGTHRYRDFREMKLPDPKIKYSLDFKVLAERYGSDVDESQFRFEIPAGGKTRDDQKPEAEPPPPAKTRAIAVTVVDVAGKPIPKASIRLPASRVRDLDVVTTNENGVARSTKASADDISVQITAAGFRPVSWIMGNVNELRAIMVPQSSGVILDEGKPVAEAWITNESLQIRADGFCYVPSLDWDGRNKDWSDNKGRFELKTNLTLRRNDAVVPFIAVNPDRDKMAIRFVPARDLGQHQQLTLQKVCHVHGHFLLEGMKESLEVGIGLESSAGQSIGFLSTRRELTPAGLRVDFQSRIPPGDYVLKSGQTSHHAGFAIPISVPTDKSELDLRTSTVPATGAVALRGKLAPELNVQWRPGQETTWEKLRGQVVVLDFWGTWCGPCVNDMPLLMEIVNQFRDKPVQWLAVHTPNLKSFDELDRGIATCQEKAWNKRALPFTTVLDSPITGQEYSGYTSQRYGVAEWPTLIVVDREGRVDGPIPKNKLAATISRLLEDGSQK